jgi:TPR repeat protein
MGQMEAFGTLVSSATRGNGESAFELGMAYSSGSGGLPVDLVQAHRWLNVATLCGYTPAAAWRQEIAMEMEHRDVVEAQRLARATVVPILRKAA